MSIANIVISGQTVTHPGQYTATFDFVFDPPSNVRGCSCYLKVKQASIAFATTVPTNTSTSTYLISTSLSQPHSFNSVNDVLGYPSPIDANRLSNGPSKVVAMITGLSMAVEAPQILVNIPNGPEKVTITIQSVIDENPWTVDVPPHITMIFELVAADIIR